MIAPELSWERLSAEQIFGWGSLDGWQVIAAAKHLQDANGDLDAFRSRLGSVPLSKFEPQNEEMVRRLHCLSQWLSFGLPVFSLTHSLLAGLALTDPSRIRLDSVRWPFPSFAVSLPTPFWTCPEIKGSDVKLLWYSECTSREMQNGRLLWVGTPARHGYRNGMGWRWTTGGDGRSVHEVMYERKHGCSPCAGAESPKERSSELLIDAAFRVMVNLALYLAECHSPDYGARQKQNAKKGRALRPQTYVIGHEVKLRPELIDAAKHWMEAQSGDRRRWSVSKRFVVRGHWREKQVCGSMVIGTDGRRRWGSDRHRKWIEPHWKGDGPKVLMRVYDVSRPKVLS